TPVGNDGQAVPFPIEWLLSSHFVFDLIYQPPITPLVRGARDRGAHAINGLSMLLFQGLAAFEIWTGQPAPEAEMRAALERAILVQVLAFDLKTRYILDLVMFPSWVIALALAFVTPWTPYATWPWPDWRTAPVAALIAGGVFLLLYLGGQFVFGTEAFGFGDVKLAVFIGMATGLSSLRMVHALLYGVFLGGFVAIILL